MLRIHKNLKFLSYQLLLRIPMLCKRVCFYAFLQNIGPDINPKCLTLMVILMDPFDNWNAAD